MVPLIYFTVPSLRLCHIKNNLSPKITTSGYLFEPSIFWDSDKASSTSPAGILSLEATDNLIFTPSENSSQAIAVWEKPEAQSAAFWNGRKCQKKMILHVLEL